MRASRPFVPDSFGDIGIIMDKEGQTQVLEIEAVGKRKKSMVRGLAAGHCSPLRDATVT